MSKYGVLSGPYFPVFGLNTEIYSVIFRIQSECSKIRSRKDSVFGLFHAVQVASPLFSTNNLASTALLNFVHSCKEYVIPSRVRADEGFKL